MRKLLFIFLLFYSFNVNAMTYYSDYGDYSEWSKDSIVESDTTYVEKERRYLYYHDNIIGDYYEEGTEPSFYIKDNSNYHEEVSDWVTVKPSEGEIEEQIAYYYKYTKPIRYIIISNVHGTDGMFKIPEIRVVARSQELQYYIDCIGCSNNFEEFISNKKIDENNSYIIEKGKIIIDLNGYYNIDEVLLTLYVYDEGDEDVSFEINYKNELDGFNYYSKSYYNRFSTEISSPKILHFDLSNIVVDTPLWTNELKTYTPIESNKMMQVREVIEYRTKIIKYYYYKSMREYNEFETDYYNLLSDDKYVDYYRYKTRDKVIIKDDIVIYNDEKLESFIDYSNVHVDVESNINYSKNGKYNVKYITPFNVIEREVVVDRLDNKINELNSIINSYITQIDSLNKDNEINKNEIGRLTNELSGSNEIIDSYLKQISEYNLKIEQLSKEVDNYKNKNDVDNYNKYIEELNNYKMKLESVNNELFDYKNKLNVKDKENNRMKKEYENEIINLKMSINDKDDSDNKCEVKKVNIIPFIILWLLVIIMLIIIVISSINSKRKSSFVETV